MTSPPKTSASQYPPDESAAHVRYEDEGVAQHHEQHEAVLYDCEHAHDVGGDVLREGEAAVIVLAQRQFLAGSEVQADAIRDHHVVGEGLRRRAENQSKFIER